MFIGYSFVGVSSYSGQITASNVNPSSYYGCYNATQYGYNYYAGNMYNGAISYFNANSITNYLIGLTLGGGSATGSWTTGTTFSYLNYAGITYNTISGIYSIYQAVTTSGTSFSYTETGTGNTITGTGTATLQYGTSTVGGINRYNCLVMDIEHGGTTQSLTSTGQDFINLFKYIKTNANSTFNGTGVIIIVTPGHTASQNISVIQPTIFQEIYSGGTSNNGYYDYISPQLYTCQTGCLTEYTANSIINWSGTPVGSTGTFTTLLEQNSQYTNYGINMIAPALWYNTLYTSGGTNSGNPTNLYYYASNYPSTSPASYGSGGSSAIINYTTDNGAKGFFQEIFGKTSGGGGSAQWNNGTLTAISGTGYTGPTSYP